MLTGWLAAIQDRRATDSPISWVASRNSLETDRKTARTLALDMALCNIEDLRAAVATGDRLFGLDVGERTIGMAVSDGLWTIATPIGTVQRTRYRPDAEALFGEMDARGARALIVGLPINMDGTEGPRCQATRQFSRNLLELRDMPIAFWDERLSTAAVERAMVREADLSRKKRKRRIDSAAAAYILQGALDALSYGSFG